MTAYAIGHLRTVDQNEEVVAYLQAIDATLAPFGGRFLVHGTTPVVKEAPFDGVVVIIGFPDLAAAEAWYASDAYQAILPLRTRNADSSVVLVEGCDPDHRATDILADASFGQGV